MSITPDSQIKANGGCLCGTVRYQILGDLPGIVNCHCSKCRLFNGHFAAWAIIPGDDLKIVADQGLKWFRLVTDETPNVYRGFCGECGSSLFWDPRGEDRIAVAASLLDEPTNVQTIGHAWVCEIGDYYQIDDDLPKYVKGWEKSELAR